MKRDFICKSMVAQKGIQLFLTTNFVNRVHRCSSILFLIITLFTLSVGYAQTESLASTSGSGNDFKQFATKDQDWINSILQQNNSTYYEGSSTLQRFVLVGIPVTTGNKHVLTLSHLATKGGHHAYDFITSYDQAKLDYKSISGNDFVGLTVDGAAIGPPVTAQMILDLYNGPNAVSAAVPAAADYATVLGQNVGTRVSAYDVAVGGASKRGIQIYGNAPISNAKLIFKGYTGDGLGGSEAYAQYDLEWTSSSTEVLFLFAGHLALGPAHPNFSGVDYGMGLGAGAISGGPYHFKLHELDGASLGSQDNQIKAGDIVIPPPPCTIAPATASLCVGGQNPSFSGPAGMASYSWSITPSATLLGANTQTVTVVDPPAGNYTLKLVTTNFGVTSTNNCTASLVVYPLPNVVADNNKVCVGGSVQLAATPPGGTWSGDNISAEGIFDSTGLAPGVYNVSYSFTDANGCSNSGGAVVTVNAIPGIQCPGNANAPVLCGVSETIAQSQANLDFTAWLALGPQSSGNLVVTKTYNYSAGATPANEGDAPLILAFTDPTIISTSVTVTWKIKDSVTGCENQCIATWTLEYGCAPGCTVESKKDVSCFGGSNGEISVAAAGGTPNYTIYLFASPINFGDSNWFNNYLAKKEGLAEGEITTFSNLSAGSYLTIAEDAITLLASLQSQPCPVSIEQPPLLEATDSHQDVKCNAGNDGSVTVTFSGGTSPYQINFNGGGFETKESPVVYSNLSAGNYTWVVKDENGCIVEGNEVIGQPGDFSVSCPAERTLEACVTAEEAQLAFNDWKDDFVYNDGGGSVTITYEPPLDQVVLPNLCGGEVTLKIIARDICGNSKECKSTFRVISPDIVDVSGPQPFSASQCDYANQAALDAAFAAWLEQFKTLNDGCGAVAEFSGDPRVAPRLCDGGTVNVTYSIRDNCIRDSVSASFTINGEADVDVSGPQPFSASQCDYADQAVLDAAFAAWLEQFKTLNDGCGAVAEFSGDPRIAPRLCDGGTVNVTYSIRDNCSRDSVSASFTINGEADVDVSGPQPFSASQCDYANQAALDAAFAAWLEQFKTLNDGCGAVAEFSGDPRVAPRLCDGGTVNVTYSIRDNCSRDSVSASFTINGEADVDVSGPQPFSASQCDYADQAALDAAFAAWLEQFKTLNDGCGAVAEFSGDPRVAPRLCDGGTVNVTYSIRDNCSRDSVSASFTINGEADVDVSGPQPFSASQCDYADQAVLDAAFAAWLEQFKTLNDGCGAVAEFSGDLRIAPRLCDGGTVNVTYSIRDNCSRDSVSASFTINGEADVDVSGPQPFSASQCDYADQAALDAVFAAWLEQFKTLNDGCGAVAEFSGDPRIAPRLCDGGTVNVTYSIRDNCSRDSVSASFTINGEADVDVSGPQPFSASQCDYADQAALDAAFAAWLEQFKTLNDGCGAVAEFSGDLRIAPRLCDGGTVSVTYSIRDNCSRDSVSASFTISEVQKLAIYCPENVSLTCDDNAQEAFNVWISGFRFEGGCSPQASDLSSYVLPTPGNSLTIDYVVKDNCDELKCSSMFTTPICEATHCSYTQGFYGNVNGNACLPDGTLSKAQGIMAAAVDAQPGDYFDFGSYANGNYFRLKLSDIIGKPIASDNNIFRMLPGGGTPRKLVGWATYDVPSTWQSDSDPLNYAKGKRGSINNNLLSQTMTLFFNISMDSSLGNVKLKSDFKTVAELGCGTDDVDPNDPGQVFSISNNVINYWGAGATPTVNDLFILANKVLSGEVTSISASEVNGAVDAINRGFDECRIEVPVLYSPLTVTEEIVVAEETAFTSYPVPFENEINVVYTFDYKTDVDLQMYDAKGMLLLREVDRNAYKGKQVTLRPKFNVGKGQLFFVKMITNRGVVVKKVYSKN